MRVLMEKKYFFIHNITEFFSAVDDHPELSELLILEFFKDKVLCLSFLAESHNAYGNLLLLIRKFPKYKAEIFEKLFANNQKIWSLTTDPAGLAKEIPEYRKALFQRIEENKDEFFRNDISNVNDFLQLIKLDTNLAIHFIDGYLNDDECFKKIFPFWSEFLRVLNLSFSIKNKLEHLLFTQGKVTERFIRLIGYHIYFADAAHRYKQYTDQLFSRLLEDKLFFEAVIGSAYHLRRILDEHPQYIQACFNKLLNDEEQFQRLITSYPILRDIANSYPQYANSLVEKVLNNPLQFRDMIGNFEQFRGMIVAFKVYGEKITRLMLNDDRLFQRVVTSIYMLTKALEVTNNLVNPEEITLKVFSFYDNFKDCLQSGFLSYYGSGAQIVKLSKFTPQIAEEILVDILNDKRLFSKVFSWDSFHQLSVVMEAFPQYKDLITYRISRDPKTFREVVLHYEFEKFKTKFSDRRLYQTTRDHAIEKVEASCESMKRTSEVLEAIRREHTHTRFALNNYTSLFITALTADCEVHNQRTAEEVASEFCARFR